MPVNPDGIDLNSDTVSGDRRNEQVTVSEPSIRINFSATETLMKLSNAHGHVEDSSVARVIDEISDLGGANDSAKSFRGLFDHECVDRVEEGGVGDENAAFSEGLSLNLTDCVLNVDASCGDLLGAEKNRGDDEIERGSTEVKIMNVLEGDSSIGVEGGVIGKELGLDSSNVDASCGDLLGSEIERGSTEVMIMGDVEGYSSIGVEVIGEKNCSTLPTKTVIDGHGGKYEKFAQAAAMFSGEVEGGWNENPHHIEEILHHGVRGTVGSNLIPAENNLIQNVVDSGCLQEEDKLEYSQVTEFVEQLPDKNLVVQAKIGGSNDLMPEDQNEGLTFEGCGNQSVKVETPAEIDANQMQECHVSEVGFSQCTGKESNLVSLVVDLNPYINADGLEVWFGNGGTEVKDVSGVNGFGLNGNQDVVVEEQVTDIEKWKASEKNFFKSAASKPGFSVSDLVWGKVQSHPWWPGQIFDPSDSSRKARNYFKEGSFLVAYFGDGTFAWNVASRIKPFGLYFSQMEKQINMETFCHAVDCALDEISGRVEFGLACSCLSDEVYSKIKSQIIVNSGIREESRRRSSGDEYSSAASFEPVKLIEYINALARFPYGRLDRLELVIAQAQLLSFYRWKGYPHLPEFKMLGGLLDNDAHIPLLGKKKHCGEVNKDAFLEVEGQVTSGKGKLKDQDSSSRKRKHSSDDSMHPNKKERSLSDLMTRNHSYLLNGESESEGKAGSKLISSSFGRKHKAVESVPDDSAVKNQRSPLSMGATNMSPESKQTFRVGDIICRVASQLNGSTPILKYSDGTSQKTKVKNESKEKSAKVSYGGSPHSSEKSRRRKKVIPIEWSSPDEMLLQLCLAAKDPMKGYNFVISMVNFFTDFRNSVCLDQPSSGKHKQSLEDRSSTKTRKKPSKSETTETSGLEYLKDSYWTDRIIESIPEEELLLVNQNETGQFMADTATGKVIATVESEAAPELSPNLESKQLPTGGNLELEAEVAVGHVNSEEDLSPTALILNFTDLDSVPSETNLNKIFSRYGPLNEAETEVMSKSSRARVIFKKRSDAETAFSSAGKFSIFGPSLVSYRLKYSPSTPRKTPSPATKRSRKDAASLESNAT